MTRDGSSMSHTGEDRSSTVASEVVLAVSDATGTPPLDLPVLNDTVDPDALNALFDAEPGPDGSQTPAVVLDVDVDGYIATVRGDGSVSVDRAHGEDVVDALGLIDDATVHVVHHDWSGSQPLLTTVVRTIVTATGADRIVVRDELAAHVDQDALDALFRPRRNGVPRGEGGLRVPFREYDVVITSDGTVAVQPTLSRIKRTGGNLLVVGSVPRQVSDETSAALLGAGTDRDRLVAVTGRCVETAFDRLDRVGADPSRTRVVDHGACGRSVVAPATSRERPAVRSVDGGVDDLADAIVDSIDGLEDARGGFVPGQFRFCLDSLGSFESRYDPSSVRRLLETVGDRIERASGIGHYVLLADPDSEHVRAIEDLFDVVVELRVGVDGPEQRWHVRETSHSTDWFSATADAGRDR